MNNDTAKEPSPEQIRTFWESCDFAVCDSGYSKDKEFIKTGEDYKYPNNHWGKRPVLNLNNLFKYAVPKMLKIIETPELDAIQIYDTFFLLWLEQMKHGIKDPTLSLFKAISEVIK